MPAIRRVGLLPSVIPMDVLLALALVGSCLTTFTLLGAAWRQNLSAEGQLHKLMAKQPWQRGF